MGAIIGALIGRKYQEKINADKMMAQHIWNTIQDATFNPNTEQTPESYQHALDFFGKKYVGKGDQEKWNNFVNLSAQHAQVFQKARKPPVPTSPATANPASAPAAMITDSTGGIGMPSQLPSPDAVQGSAGMMSQPPQVPTGIAGLIAQKKTTDLAAPAPIPQSAPIAAAAPPVLARQLAAPDADNPGINSTNPDPGFAGWTPRPQFGEQPGDVQPPIPGRVSPSVIGRRKAARELPTKEGELAAASKLDIQRDMQKMVNERLLRAEDLKKIKPILDAFPDKPTMRDYAAMEAQASVILGRPFTLPGMASLSRPQNIPGTTPGSAAPEGQLDIYDEPINKQGQYRIQRNQMTGEMLWNPTVAITGRSTMPDKDSPTGWSVFQIDRQGNIQGKTPGAAPPPAYAPIVVNGVRMQVVDFGDRKELIPIPNQSTTQRQFPGMPSPSPATAPASTPTAPVGQEPATGLPAMPAPPRNPPSGVGGRQPLGKKGVSPAQSLAMQNAITLGTHQLFGDPDDPTLRPLSSYAKLADDPGARQRLGKAFNLLIHSGNAAGEANVGAHVGPVNMSTGGIGEWLQNSLGITAAAAAAKATVINKAIADLRPEESEYLNKMMSTIPTITGFRKLTSAGAFKWSQDALERELPFIGLSATDSRSFNQKMQNLGNEPLTAIRNLERTNPGAIDPRLTDMIRGTKSLPAVGVTPPKKGSSAADEYLKSIGH